MSDLRAALEPCPKYYETPEGCGWSCDGQTTLYETAKAAITAWNRRARSALAGDGGHQTGWLVEGDGKWWGPACSEWNWREAVAGCEPNLWTADANAALRFARKEDAEAFIRWKDFQTAKATEHIWIGSAISAGWQGESEAMSGPIPPPYIPETEEEASEAANDPGGARYVGLKVRRYDPVPHDALFMDILQRLSMATAETREARGVQIAIELRRRGLTIASTSALAGDGETVREVPADVAALVVAARIVAFEDQSVEAIRALDLASEAFADRVMWDGEDRRRQAEVRSELRHVNERLKQPLDRAEVHALEGERNSLLAEARSLSALPSPMPVRGEITGEKVKQIADKEASAWADRVYLGKGPDRDKLAAQKASLIARDLSEAIQILGAHGCNLEAPHD